VIIVDTSGLLAAIDKAERTHSAAAAALMAAEPPRALSPFVLAELDYLLMTRVSSGAARRFLDEVAQGSYRLETFAAVDVGHAIEIFDRYQGLDRGLADASILVLAERYGTRDVLTLDERHFRAVRDSHGRPFRILPADLAG